MKHPPFDTWIYEPTQTEEQKVLLERHLAECPECLTEYRSWQAVEHLLQKPVMVAPAPGFVNRWEIYARKRTLQARRPWLGLLVAYVAALLGLLGIAIAHFFAGEALAEWFSALIRFLVRASDVFSRAQYALWFWGREISLPWVMAVGFLLYVWLMLPLSTWLFALVKLIHQGAKIR